MLCFDLKQQRDRLWQELHLASSQEPFAVEPFAQALASLQAIDHFWTFPGRVVLQQVTHYLQSGQYVLAKQLVGNSCHHMQSGEYRLQPFRPFQTNLELLDRPTLREQRQLKSVPINTLKPYAEVLVIHPFPDDYDLMYRQQLNAFKSSHDEFVYDIVFADSAEDALNAILANTDIQACVYLNHLPVTNGASNALLTNFAQALLATIPPAQYTDSVEVNVCRTVRHLRPELNHYLISEQAASELPLPVRSYFDRVLFHVHPFQDLHAAIMGGLRQRFATPFFDALQAYSRQPKGVFHALPLSRGASVKGSPWIHDMLDFYGDNIFLAETSSTQGGLDSLLDPTGAIKQAHTKAAETFGADATYFVTNGTSTSNKIIFQANVRPGDIVLISADCHKSIPYSVMLAGAYPIFLETYPLAEHDLYGGIDLAQIKAVMLDLKAQGRLHLLKQITLTNSTFDGLIYHCEKFMMEILAIKPDVIFHWDEAWFAFAHFHPLYHSRGAMSATHKIRQRMRSTAYQEFYAQWAADFQANPDPQKWQETLYPNPALVRVRVYASQSTHKTLTAFRQASMIHVADDIFNPAAFLEAFRIHTSTSPNYQIIASLDIARRQAALEGFHMVRETIELALQLRSRISASKDLAAYFDVLDDQAMVPSGYRHPHPTESTAELARLSAWWGHSDFVIDPTRLTLNISKTGLDGSSFRQLLMSRYDIQVNKTSRHTVLFLINIGATQATVDYLLQVLQEMASHFQQQRRQLLAAPAQPTVALPEKRIFHPAYLPFSNAQFHASDLRRAYYEGADESLVTYVPLSSQTLAQVAAGRQWVSASFVTPYPPGFPVVVPGQIITLEIIEYFQHIAVKEIHGFSADRGFKVFTDDHLATLMTTKPS
jgi:arginine decarboxylase